MMIILFVMKLLLILLLMARQSSHSHSPDFDSVHDPDFNCLAR